MLGNITWNSVVYSKKTCYYKFERDVTGTNIVLLEIRNHLLIHYAKPGEGTDGSNNDSGNVDYSAILEREIKSLQ